MPSLPKFEIGSDKEFYKNNLWKDAPIFFKPFFLEAITNEWRVTYACVAGRLTAVMPFQYDAKKNFIRRPPFNIYQGPYIHDLSGFSLTEQMMLLEQLESSLPSAKYYNQNWHPTMRNWLPFFWKGYTQSTRYSYVIKPQGMEVVRSRYNENVRRNIKKAVRNHIVVCESQDARDLFVLIQKTFARKNQDNPIHEATLAKLLAACHAENCAKVLLAKSEGGEHHAAMFLVSDEKCVYYLAGGIDEKSKNSGAMTLLFDFAIQWAIQGNKQFDFEGSMMPSIEAFFRSFGSSQQEYFVVTRVTSWLLRVQLQMASKFPAFTPF